MNDVCEVPRKCDAYRRLEALLVGEFTQKERRACPTRPGTACGAPARSSARPAARGEARGKAAAGASTSSSIEGARPNLKLHDSVS